MAIVVNMNIGNNALVSSEAAIVANLQYPTTSYKAKKT